MRASDIPVISRLNIQEKIELMEDLWDTIAADESALPVPSSHRDELDRRQELYENAPDQLLSLEELKTKIDRRT